MASNLMAQDWLSDGRNQEKSMFLHDHLKKKKIHLKFQYLAVLFYLKMFPWKIIQSHICSVVEGQSRESLTVTGASRVPMLMVLVV